MFIRRAMGLASIALGLGLAPALAAEPQDPDLQPFSAAEFATGYSYDPARCSAYRTAVWVVVDNQPECVRYFAAGENTNATEAVIWMNGDLGTDVRDGKTFPSPHYATLTPDAMMKNAARLVEGTKMIGIVLARPGTFGSTGLEPVVRGTIRSARIIAAALDAIKARYKLRVLHIGGQSGGGNMTAAMVNMRSDVGCAVLASGSGAKIEAMKDRNPKVSPDSMVSMYDASQLVKTAKPGDRLRLFVLTDQGDVYVSARSQAIYVAAAQAAGLPVRQIVTLANEPEHHGLASQGTWALSACAQGSSDAQLWAGVMRISDRERLPPVSARPQKVADNSAPR